MDNVVPLPTKTLPVNVFAPDRVNRPPPVSFKPKPPEMTPLSASEPKLVMLIVGVVCSARGMLIVFVND